MALRYIYKHSGKREAFDPQKLENSLTKAGVSLKTARKITTHIQKHGPKSRTTAQLSHWAGHLLSKYDEHATLVYSLRDAVSALGRDGFLFEHYVSAILENYGYTVQRNVYAQGACLSHEIDLVIRNNTQTYLGEAKFHNHGHTHTHLDKLMYAEGRVIDVSQGNQWNDKHPKLWMITNTKFSDSAQKYAMCKGLTITSWNMPKDRSLYTFILEKQAFPVTSLHGLNQKQRHKSFSNGIVLAHQVLGYNVSELAKRMGVSYFVAKKMHTKAHRLFAS